MNPALATLQPYPFEKLARLKNGVTPNPDLAPLDLSIGEPKHPVAEFIRRAMSEALDDISRYPTTRGEADLRRAAAHWLTRRFHLAAASVDPERGVLPVNGTREALFSVAAAVVDPSRPHPTVMMPNPFYQIYEGATLMAGARPFTLATRPANGFLPNYREVPAEVWERVQLLYLCSPGNPTGAVHPLELLCELIELSDRYHFVIAADECYSEIWYDHPPPGLLQAAQTMGRTDHRHCLVFHSLSKRSNMPGARTGFMAGDPELLQAILQLRTYTGCSQPPFIQKAAIAAWQDEEHVADNRALYAAKLASALTTLSPVLPVVRPEAGFYLWLEVPGGGESFARRLYQDYHVTVLPGGYLGRPSPVGDNPGDPYVRIALVAPRKEHQEAMARIRACASALTQ